MGQRVNIQYSVELDELQDEVNRLFGKAITELEKLQPVGGTPIVKMQVDGLEKIDLIRQKLNKVDIMLGDVQNIIQGYVRFKTQPAEATIPDSTSEVEELEIEHLEDRLSKFKEMLNAQPDQEFEEAN